MAVIEIDVHLTDEVLSESLKTLALASEKAISRAFNRAKKKTGSWLSTQVARDVSGLYGIKQKAFKDFRIRVSSALLNQQDKPVLVWIGYQPIAAHHIANPKADKGYGGAWARDYFFKGGFVGESYQGERVIYKRRGRRRLPIDVQKIDIRNGAILAVNRLIKRAEERFKTILGQEVNFELSKLK